MQLQEKKTRSHAFAEKHIYDTRYRLWASSQALRFVFVHELSRLRVFVEKVCCVVMCHHGPVRAHSKRVLLIARIILCCTLIVLSTQLYIRCGK